MSDMDMAMKIPVDKLDPKYKYTWVLDEPKTQTVFKMREYEPVKVQDPDGQKLKDDPRMQTDGKMRIGDAVLMRCRKEIADARDADKKKRLEARIPAIKENYHAEVANLGIESFEDDKP